MVRIRCAGLVGSTELKNFLHQDCVKVCREKFTDTLTNAKLREYLERHLFLSEATSPASDGYANSGSDPSC